MPSYRRTGGLDGLGACLAALDAVGASAAKEMRAAAGEVGSDAVKFARSVVPQDTKSLRKALGKRVRAYRKGQVVAVVVGARKDTAPKSGRPAKQKFTTYVVRKGSRKVTKAVPANYLHLVEYGTRPHAVGGGDELGGKQDGKPHPGAAPRPFLAETAAHTARVGSAIMVARVARQIRKLTARRRAGVRK